MATSPAGSTSARKSEVMSDLEVRLPVPPAQSTADVVDQVLANVRGGQPDPAARPDALAAKTPSTPSAFSAMEARKPPGPQVKSAPPLKGAAAATPPKGPS